MYVLGSPSLSSLFVNCQLLTADIQPQGDVGKNKVAR